MTTKAAIEAPGIDLSFRPESCFWPMCLETHLLSRIKVAERRAIVEGLVKAGRVVEVFDILKMNFGDDGHDPDDIRRFSSVTSGAPSDEETNPA